MVDGRLSEVDTRVMKTFCDLVDTGSFVRAAEIANISQPAVSQRLAKLEAEMGTQLINRGGGPVEPTEAGKAFYAAGQDILQRFDAMSGEVRSAALGGGGTLRVGTIYSVGLYLLQSYIRAYIAAHPEVNVVVEYTDAVTITERVLDGRMDLGVVAYPEKHRALRSIFFTGEQLAVVCAPGHPMARQACVSPEELAGVRFVALSQPVPTRRYIDRTLKRMGVQVNVVMEFDNIDTLKRAVEVNAGLSILPRNNVEREVAAGSLACVPFRDPKEWVREIGILRRRGKAPSRPERDFLSLLRSPPPVTRG